MSWNKRKCLVTGGASFIGSHLVETLLHAGAAVRVADDLSSGLLSNLTSVKSDIEFMQGDLRHMDFAFRASAGCDTVFHLAADHGGRGYISTHPANCISNLALDNIVFETAAKNGVERIMFASSACVYPTDIQKEKCLLQEDMVYFDRRGGAFADEEYGWAKLMGELSLRAYQKQYGVKTASARISTAYGPRENESHAVIALIAKAFIKQSPFEIWGTGEQTRGFTYVQDVVSGLMLACEHISDGSSVNVGTSDYISVQTVSEEIFKSMGWYPESGVSYLFNSPVGVMHRALDGSYAKKMTGWVPNISLEVGIKKTVEWYISHKNPQDVARSLNTLLMER